MLYRMYPWGKFAIKMCGRHGGKVMKERIIFSGLGALLKKQQGGHNASPPPPPQVS